MIVVAVLLAVALVIALVRIAGDRRRFQAARRQAGAGDGDLVGALRRRERESVPRAELSEALAVRDAAMGAAAGPVLVLDPAGLLVRANRPARELLPDLAAGEPVARGPLEPLAAAIAGVASGGSAGPVELTVYEPERRRFEASLRRYATAAGDHGCVVALADHSSEADYRDARRLFSAGVSHELRTPLARILALVETLALPLDDGARAETIEQARLEVDGMRRLLDDMILLVRLESHEPVEGPASVDVAAAVSAAVERHLRAATAREMPVTREVAGGLVVGVPDRLLDAVLDNLIENAIAHAGPGSSIAVTARGLGGAVELTVADDGAGIPVEHLGRVFERFYRVESARSGPGTGLGLAIVKHIAEEYGGRATAESAGGRGTTMRVVLPAPAATRRAGV